MPASASSRPRRADAERNRARILDAAAELFAERGLDASMPELAERAGVGVGTVYRAFPDKEHLLGAVMATRMHWFADEVEAAVAADDAWAAFADVMRKGAALHLKDRAYQECMPDALALPDVRAARERILDAMQRLIGGAQAQGVMRADVVAPTGSAASSRFNAALLLVPAGSPNHEVGAAPGEAAGIVHDRSRHREIDGHFGSRPARTAGRRCRCRGGDLDAGLRCQRLDETAHPAMADDEHAHRARRVASTGVGAAGTANHALCSRIIAVRHVAVAQDKRDVPARRGLRHHPQRNRSRARARAAERHRIVVEILADRADDRHLRFAATPRRTLAGSR